MIESVHNPKVKRWAELLTKKGREKHRAFLLEGVRLVQEAMTSNEIEAVLWESGQTFSFLETLPKHIEQWEVSPTIMKKLTDTQHSQGVAAIVKMNEQPSLSYGENALLLLVEAVQDPGNLGTIIRSADAAGCDAVILGSGTVDLYNSKTVRSTMGSLFHLPILRSSLPEAIADLKAKEFQIIGSSLETSHYFHEIQYSDRVAIIVGNEGNGISDEILQLADDKVKIPIYGKAESLNVGIATSLLLYEARRNSL